MTAMVLTREQALGLRMVAVVKRRSEITTRVDIHRAWLAENGFIEWQSPSGWHIAPAGAAWLETHA